MNQFEYFPKYPLFYLMLGFPNRLQPLKRKKPSNTIINAVNKHFENRRSIIMPRKYANSGNNGAYGGFKFANVSLTVDDKKNMFGWMEQNSEDIPIMLDQILMSGHSIKFSHKNDQDTISMSITCLDEKSPNYQLIMMSFAPSMYDAMCVGAYKFHVMLGDKPWGELDNDTEWG